MSASYLVYVMREGIRTWVPSIYFHAKMANLSKGRDAKLEGLHFLLSKPASYRKGKIHMLKKMVKRVSALLAAAILLFTGIGKPAEAAGLDMSTFKIYYGSPKTTVLNKMKDYKVMIIDPNDYTKAQIDYIKSRGTKVFGYVSIMEMNGSDQTVQPYITAEDYVYENGQKVYFSEWNSYLMDISRPSYQEALLKRVKTQIVDKGLDGVFYDTVDQLEGYFYKKANQPVMMAGYKQFLDKVSTLYPNLQMIQNRGFETLKAVSLPYMDAVLWENFSASLKKDAWSQNWITTLQSYKKTNGLTIVTTVPNATSKKYSNQLGFPAMVNSTSIYNNW